MITKHVKDFTPHKCMLSFENQPSMTNFKFPVKKVISKNKSRNFDLSVVKLKLTDVTFTGS